MLIKPFQRSLPLLLLFGTCLPLAAMQSLGSVGDGSHWDKEATPAALTLTSHSGWNLTGSRATEISNAARIALLPVVARRHVKPVVLPIRSVTPVEGLQIHSSRRLRRGQYQLSDPGNGVIQVTGNDIDLDCTGVKLEGDGKGVGLRIVNAHRVFIRGLSVSNYLWGVVVEDSSYVTIQNCTASQNGDLPSGTVIDESGKAAESNHGGGYLLRNAQHCRVLACAAQHEWDGLDAVGCNNNTFRGNDFSYLNNWGLHLWGSSHNTFSRNRSIWCTTGEGGTFQGSSGWPTLDSAAVLMEHSSAYNLIENNDLRYGGDGVFIRANEGPVTPGSVVPPQHASNHNWIRNNDCSFSPNNAIEADLCDNNEFLHNNCSFSNYGLWLGYSRRAIVEKNTVVGCTSRGLQIENGQDNIIAHNTFMGPADKPAQSLIYLYQNGRDKTPSGPYTVLGNVLVGSTQPIELTHTRVTAGGNQLLASGAQLFFGDSSSAITHTDPETTPDEPKPTLADISPDPVPVGGPVLPPATTATNADILAMLPPYSSLVILKGARLTAGLAEPVVLVAGVPAMILTQTPTRLQLALPQDLWNRPAPANVPLQIFNGQRYSKTEALNLEWTGASPRIESITPEPAKPGQPVTVTGDQLRGPDDAEPVVTLNGVPVHLSDSTAQSLTFTAPTGLLTTHKYNLVIKGVRESVPMTLTVKVPTEWEPHIISAVFSPETLHAGDLLHFTAEVKNNAPFTLPAAEPGAGHVYGEAESFTSQHLAEQPGFVYVRVTSDIIGGSWPYLFGLPKPLPPGETEKVEGDIRVKTVGATHYRLGLVDARVRWIDDGLYNTPISVTAP